MSHDWERALIRSGPSSGTGDMEKEARWESEDTDQICVFESPLGQMEDRAEGKTGSRQTELTVR